jgi:hypothetical protein
MATPLSPAAQAGLAWVRGCAETVVNLPRTPEGKHPRRTRTVGGTHEEATTELQRWIRELSALSAARGTGS